MFGSCFECVVVSFLLSVAFVNGSAVSMSLLGQRVDDSYGTRNKTKVTRLAKRKRFLLLELDAFTSIRSQLRSTIIIVPFSNEGKNDSGDVYSFNRTYS